jgi:hypothetical protein
MPSSSAPASPEPRASGPKWRRAAWRWGAALVVGVVAVGGVLAWWKRPVRVEPRSHTGPPKSTTPSTALGDERARHVCTLDGWCVSRQSLPAVDLLAVDAVGPSDIWAVGSAGSVWHYNGRDWGGWIGLDDAPSLLAVRAFGPRDVWVVSAQSRVLHFDGRAWKSDELPIDPVSCSPFDRWSLVGTSSEDLWLARPGGIVLRRRNGVWKVVASPLSSQEQVLRANTLIAKGPGDVWIAGERIVTYSAEGWRPVSDLVSVHSPQSLHRLADGTVVVDQGGGGKDLLLVRGQKVTRVPPPATTDRRDLAGSSARDLWVIAGEGVRTSVEHWDGAAWGHQEIGHALNALVSVGAGRVLAVGVGGERRYLGSAPKRLEVSRTRAWNLARAPSVVARNGGPELWLVGNGHVDYLRNGAWTTLSERTTGLHGAVAVSESGNVDVAAENGAVLHADRSAPDKLSARPNPFADDQLAAVAHDRDGAAWILSRRGGVARWEGHWAVQRRPEEELGDRYIYTRGIAVDAAGAAWLHGEQFVGDAARTLAAFIVRRGPKGWEKSFPKPVDVEACRMPRGDFGLDRAGQLVASSGTPRHPCLLRWDGERWAEVPLLTGSAGSLMDASARFRAEALIVLHLGEDDERRSFLALCRADGWHVERAPMGNIIHAVLDPDSGRAWLVPESGSLLDLAAEEAWRFATPTLVLGDAEPTVSLAERMALATPVETPAPASNAHGDAWTRAVARGRAATLGERYAEAIAAFDAALAAEPHDPRALAERGYARLRAGELDAAAFDLRSARRRTTDPALLRAIEHNLELVAEQWASGDSTP